MADLPLEPPSTRFVDHVVAIQEGHEDIDVRQGAHVDLPAD